VKAANHTDAGTISISEEGVLVLMQASRLERLPGSDDDGQSGGLNCPARGLGNSRSNVRAPRSTEPAGFDICAVIGRLREKFRLARKSYNELRAAGQDGTLCGSGWSSRKAVLQRTTFPGKTGR
jgi:hypothetical protein